MLLSGFGPNTTILWWACSDYTIAEEQFQTHAAASVIFCYFLPFRTGLHNHGYVLLLRNKRNVANK